jgi:isoleucyl-tRNA synthetase
LLRLMAPILSFTAEEAWAVLTGKADDSVFFQTWHALPRVPEAAALIERWREIRATRAEVQKELEKLREAGKIGASLAAHVEIHSPSGARHAALAALGDELRFVMITSQAAVRSGADAIRAAPSPHRKCERCWHYRADVGADPAHPTICGRCASNLSGAGETRRFA